MLQEGDKTILVNVAKVIGLLIVVTIILIIAASNIGNAQ